MGIDIEPTPETSLGLFTFAQYDIVNTMYHATAYEPTHFLGP